jgi:hypothetical protein
MLKKVKNHVGTAWKMLSQVLLRLLSIDVKKFGSLEV